MTVTLDVEAWHAVGTIDAVRAFLPQGPSHVPIGTYKTVNPMLPLGAVAECACHVGSVLADADGETASACDEGSAMAPACALGHRAALTCWTSAPR
jgi:hypothetical protein